MTLPKTWLCVAATLWFTCCGAVALAFAQSGPAPPPKQRMEAAPEDLLEVGVTEKLGEGIPLDLEFQDSQKNTIQLKEICDGERPVILTLNYSNCPMLCNLQLVGLFECLKQMEWDLGDKFRMVSVSIDPAEPAVRAALTRKRYLKQYGRPVGPDGLRFLVGEEKHIRALADSVGFRYKYIAEKDQYAHAAATIILMPDGTVSRYLYDVGQTEDQIDSQATAVEQSDAKRGSFHPQSMKLALLEASEGKIGSTMDQVLLFCYQYDEASGKYAPAATQIMKLAGLLAVITLGAVLLGYWVREARRSSRSDIKPEGEPTQVGA